MNRKSQVLDLLARRDVAWSDVVFCAEVGSTVYGLGVDGQDDLDLIVVRVEPWHELIVGPQDRQSMMIRTQPDGRRSRMGDIDLNVYTVRKYAALLGKLNPSILNTLFLPPTAIEVNHLHPESWRGLVASKQAAAPFLGYMRQQLERWKGERGQKNVNRPELVRAYGFDTKYAAHIIRLGIQGAEYLRSGKVTIPFPAETARRLRGLRTGELAESQALEWAHMAEEDLRTAERESELPETPNLGGLMRRVATFYRGYTSVH